jgi:transposase
MFYPTYVHCKRPKVLCPHCGVKQVTAPWERKNSRCTLLFEGYAMLVMADTPVAKAARLLRSDEQTLTSILRYWVNKAVAEMDLREVALLAIDETSFKRGHKYVTLIIDAAKRRVIDVEEGKDGDTIRKFVKQPEAKNGAKENITNVTSDMSKAFIGAVSEQFPNAELTVDKFHVKQKLIEALDEVRKDEQKSVADKKRLFQGRRLFMIPERKLTAEQSVQIVEMSKLYPKTGRAYRIISAFDEFYASRTPEEAEKKFNGLYSRMRRCRLTPMKKAAETLSHHKERILSFFKSRLTNAICEGINLMVQAAKRKARGFGTIEGFKAMIYLAAGKPELALPSPF